MDGCVDNPVAQRLLVRQLQHHDLNVIATSNGEEAVTGNRLVFQRNLTGSTHCPVFRMGTT